MSMTDSRDIAKLRAEMRARAEAQLRIGVWCPIAKAPLDTSWLEVRLADERVLLAHYACDMTGEYQPPFKGWFDSDLCEINEPVEWRRPVELGPANVIALLAYTDACERERDEALKIVGGYVVTYTDVSLARAEEKAAQIGAASAKAVADRTRAAILTFVRASGNPGADLDDMDGREFASWMTVFGAVLKNDDDTCERRATAAEDARDKLKDELAAAREMIARLCEAIEPFCRPYPHDDEPDHWPAFGKRAGQDWPTVGDFRRAARALADVKEAGDGG